MNQPYVIQFAAIITIAFSSICSGRQGLDLDLRSRTLIVDTAILELQTGASLNSRYPLFSSGRGVWEFNNLVERGTVAKNTSGSKTVYNWNKGDDALVLSALVEFGGLLPGGISSRTLFYWAPGSSNWQIGADSVTLEFDGLLPLTYDRRLFDKIVVFVNDNTELYFDSETCSIPKTLRALPNVKRVRAIMKGNKLADFTTEAMVDVFITECKAITNYRADADSHTRLFISGTMCFQGDVTNSRVSVCDCGAGSCLCVRSSLLKGCSISVCDGARVFVDSASSVAGSRWVGSACIDGAYSRICF